MDQFDEGISIRGEFMPLSILRALWKRKLMIFLTWMIVTIVSAVVVYQLPAVYQARTVILIEGQRIPSRMVTSTVNEDLSSRLNRISQQILSYEPLLRLIEEFDLYREDRGSKVQEEIVSEMRKNISVRVVDGWTKSESPAFQISFEGPDPSVVAQVANRLGTLFINENLRARANQALGTTEFLQNQLEDARRDVERQEEQMRNFRLQHMGELPEQQAVMLAEMRRLEAELDRLDGSETRANQSKLMLENSLQAAESNLELIQRMEEQERSRLGVPTGSDPDDPNRGLALELQQAIAQRDSLQARYSASHPDVVVAGSRVAMLEQRLAQAQKEWEQSLAAAAAASAETNADAQAAVASQGQPLESQAILRERERIQSTKIQIQLLDEDLAGYEARRAEIRGEIGALDARMSRLPINDQELKKVVRGYEIAQRNYSSLLAKSMEAGLAQEMETRQKAEKFSTLEPARLPEKPIRPDRMMLLAITCGTGLGLGCFLAFGVELRRNVILGEWEMPAEVPVLGHIPVIQVDHGDPDVDLDMGSESSGGGGRFFPRKLVIASSLALSVIAVVATSVYFGWIPF